MTNCFTFGFDNSFNFIDHCLYSYLTFVNSIKVDNLFVSIITKPFYFAFSIILELQTNVVLFKYSIEVKFLSS